MEKEKFIKYFEHENKKYQYFDISELSPEVKNLPFSIRVLLENILRKYDGKIVKDEHINEILEYKGKYDKPFEIPFYPARVLMQDFTGVPCVVDLAMLRDAVNEKGLDASMINPQVPVELICDHSVQIDYYGASDALNKNVALEYSRNSERYKLLKWAQKSFENFKVVPPNSGICHQVNLEYLGRVAMTDEVGGSDLVFPDTVVGTDSHTPMINGIGVLGWGVGGIEAEAVALGQPYFMALPEVIGVRLYGELKEGVTATDLILTITEMLRKYKVVGKFVEFFGQGVLNLPIPDRATISNMTPECGSTVNFFPVDSHVVDFLGRTNRKNYATLTEKFYKLSGMFFKGDENPKYTDLLELDLSKVEPCLAGPSRPQDKIFLKDIKVKFDEIIENKYSQTEIVLNDERVTLKDGSVVIAAITSCTNTSNPSVMIGAGLVARKAVEKGLKVKPYVKTSLAPGSKVVTDYLKKSNLLPYLEALGFHVAAYGCTTCIGNSGPLNPVIEKAIVDNKLNVASVLSGNRNFEARVHNRVRSNFLASPMLVVAFAIAGKVNIDMDKEPLGYNPNGEPVYLKDIWPSQEEIAEYVQNSIDPEFYKKEYSVIFDGDKFWQSLDAEKSKVYSWDENSTYIKKPPFVDDFDKVKDNGDINDAYALLVLGDSVTTDHISPAGSIPKDYPAGRYLLEHGVKVEDFNSYGSRRGNHEVMMRGTFANVRIKNRLVAPKEGGFTVKFPEKEEGYVFDIAMQYLKEGRNLIVLGKKEYGSGSSRDWAAKGTVLLGVKAVIAESFERIHKSNLVGMGVLPLQFREGQSYESLGISGNEKFSILGLGDLKPGQILKVIAEKEDGAKIEFEALSRLDTEIEVEYYKSGGILPYVLKKFVG
ncbi:aconitate hydratase AcnA [Deferribacterales bacterium Es71-Z0220]|uniref:aconitate hydratase AcnA n=1 Tax=Deferrivibrio essentukiensis TaxID=2880922 RepID=UPI001F620D4F|nr:aconitate hydratase AcnA [Deferrivibrio essentukiensis]MCB4203506.1 aconitate hydratase AcnA [Deferrivibrio essentukiensis]